jgi:nucleotide-binding universal stress UspA family protein
VGRVVLGLASGRGTAVAIDHAIMLAQTHRAELVGLAIIDTKILSNVGPVPIGGNYYAARLRNSRIGRARHALADAIQLFEQAAMAAGIRFSVQVEEGNPVAILRDWLRDDSLLLVGSSAWFDQGISGRSVDPMVRLARAGIRPVIGVPSA